MSWLVFAIRVSLPLAALAIGWSGRRVGESPLTAVRSLVVVHIVLALGHAWEIPWAEYHGFLGQSYAAAEVVGLLLCGAFLVGGRRFAPPTAWLMLGVAAIRELIFLSWMLDRNVSWMLPSAWGVWRFEQLGFGVLVALGALAATGYLHPSRRTWALAAAAVTLMVPIDLWLADTRWQDFVLRSELPIVRPRAMGSRLAWEVGTRALLAVLAVLALRGDAEERGRRVRGWFWVWVAVELPDLLPTFDGRYHARIDGPSLSWSTWCVFVALVALPRVGAEPARQPLEWRPLDPVTALVALGIAGAGSWWLWPAWTWALGLVAGVALCLGALVVRRE